MGLRSRQTKALEVPKGCGVPERPSVYRWAVAVQKYSFRVEDIPGKENVGVGQVILVSVDMFSCKLLIFCNMVISW